MRGSYHKAVCFSVNGSRPIESCGDLVHTRGSVLTSGMSALVAGMSLNPIKVRGVRGGNGGRVFSFCLGPSNGRVALVLSMRGSTNGTFYRVYTVSNGIMVRRHLGTIAGMVPLSLAGKACLVRMYAGGKGCAGGLRVGWVLML